MTCKLLHTWSHPFRYWVLQDDSLTLIWGIITHSLNVTVKWLALLLQIQEVMGFTFGLTKWLQAFTLPLHTNSGSVTHVWSWLHPSTSFLIHCTLTSISMQYQS